MIDIKGFGSCLFNNRGPDTLLVSGIIVEKQTACDTHSFMTQGRDPQRCSSDDAPAGGAARDHPLKLRKCPDCELAGSKVALKESTPLPRSK